MVDMGPSLRGMSVLHALGSLDAHDNAESHDGGFIFQAALKIYWHAPANEHARLIGRLEAFVAKFVGREVRAPGIDDERVQERLASLQRTPEEREANLAEITERIKRVRGRERTRERTSRPVRRGVVG